MDVRAVIAVSTADVPVFGRLLDALRVASVETHIETQKTFHWMNKRCNVLCDAYVVATADFCHSFYFMIKLWTQVRNLE